MKSDSLVVLFLLVSSCGLFSTCRGATKTYTGDNCADNHSCGTYGKYYYWCWLGDSEGRRTSSWDYCCRPDHPCDNYGYSYNWCYNGNSWVKDCTPLSEVKATKTAKGSRCADDHPCGNHGYGYYWCWKGDYFGPRRSGWDYCCEPGDTCGKHGYSYNWCDSGTRWTKCNP